jgi:hypothetical protein
MKKLLLFLLTIPACSTPAPTCEEVVQVPIPMHCRIENTTENCGFCSFETLGRYHHITRLYNLATNHSGGIGGHSGCIQTLEEYNINYKTIWDKTNTKFLDYYVREMKYGVAVAGENHILVMISWEEDNVKIIDNSGRKKLEVQSQSKKDFMRWWNGRAYVIIPDE